MTASEVLQPRSSSRPSLVRRWPRRGSTPSHSCSRCSTLARGISDLMFSCPGGRRKWSSTASCAGGGAGPEKLVRRTHRRIARDLWAGMSRRSERSATRGRATCLYSIARSRAIRVTCFGQRGTYAIVTRVIATGGRRRWRTRSCPTPWPRRRARERHRAGDRARPARVSRRRSPR